MSLGEYGVKTHPAWSREQGALAYHIRRSEEQQQQLFMAVAHYGLGMGCAKVQNWCLRDAQAWVFPWGLFYPNQLVPKDVAYTHRNLPLLWSHLEPRYETPPVLVALASNMRLGNDADVGAEIACRTYDDLLSLYLPFVSLDDASWGTMPDRDGPWIVVAGESVGGRWTNYEVTDRSRDEPEVLIDENRATLLLLVCRPAERQRWEDHLTRMFTQPYRVAGF